MISRKFVIALLVSVAILRPALAAEDDSLARMALCRDSWAEWSKSDPAKMKAFADHVRSEFVPHDNDPFARPKTDISVLGLHVTQAFPDSVGMGVGFSLTVDATFDDTRKAVEKSLGRPLGKCETGDGMRTCGLEIAPQRTVTLMVADKPGAKNTLLGCYYFYGK
jgi:hypothetical protein